MKVSGRRNAFDRSPNTTGNIYRTRKCSIFLAEISELLCKKKKKTVASLCMLLRLHIEHLPFLYSVKPYHHVIDPLQYIQDSN